MISLRNSTAKVCRLFYFSSHTLIQSMLITRIIKIVKLIRCIYEAYFYNILMKYLLACYGFGLGFSVWGFGGVFCFHWFFPSKLAITFNVC